MNQQGTTRAIRDARFKLYSTGQFFDASRDPEERTDLAASANPHHVAARERLASLLGALPPDSPPPFKLRSQAAFRLHDAASPTK